MSLENEPTNLGDVENNFLDETIDFESPYLQVDESNYQEETVNPDGVETGKSNVWTGEFNENHTTVDGFDVSKFIAEEIGSLDGTIVTGSAEEPLEYNIKDLTPKQQIAILKNHYANRLNDTSLSEDEQQVVEMLRSNRLDDLYSALGEEIGVAQPSQEINISEYSDDDIMIWKIRNDFPDMSDEELEGELESQKDSPYYDKKVNSAKSSLQAAIEAQQEQAKLQETEKSNQELQRIKKQIFEETSKVSDFFGFEADEDVKNAALADILEIPEGKQSPAIAEFLDTPQGIAQTAVLWRMMPKINEYVNSLHARLDNYEKKNKINTQQKSYVATNNKSNSKPSLEDLGIYDFS